MKRVNTCLPFVTVIAILLTVAIYVSQSRAIMAGSDSEKKEYVCAPCGCDRDGTVFEKAGTCPSCGMALVDKTSEAANAAPPSAQPERKKVAILIFDGVQIIDYTGPYEVFGQAGFEVYTVAATPEMLTTSMGMKVTPHYDISNSPRPDVLVIPGGNVMRTQNDPKVIEWIQAREKQAEYVMSVCNGAFILAKTGLLDGLSATTFYGLIEGFTSFAPKTRVVTDQRYVDNGRIITTAGLSSGIDGSLYLVSKMRGKAAAQMVALNMEYNWQPDSKYARASFADMNLRKIFPQGLRFDVPAASGLKVLSTEGGTDQWEVKWLVQTDSPAAQVLEAFNNKLAREGSWSRQAGSESATKPTSAWKFNDDKGKPWTGLASLEPVSGEKNRYALSLRIARQ